LPGALAVIRAVLSSPRDFYLNFSPEGPLREPAVFVLLVGAVTILTGLFFAEVRVEEVVLTPLVSCSRNCKVSFLRSFQATRKQPRRYAIGRMHPPLRGDMIYS
jgi:hypothetical protein